jgi:proteasome accessory factor B
MSSKHGQVRIFKVDRVQSVEILPQHFHVRDLGEIVDQLAKSWGGVVFGEDRYDVTVDFNANVAQRIGETHWHASQRLEPIAHGGVRLRVVLPSLLEFVPWVLGWGADAVVVGPDELWQQVADAVRAMAANYGIAS